MTMTRPDGDARQYVVLRFPEGWRILSQGWRAGRFESRQEAVSTAERLAREAQALGERVEFLVQSVSGELEPRPLTRGAGPRPGRPDRSVRRRMLSDSWRAGRPLWG